MIRMRRLFTAMAAALLAGAPTLAAQSDAPNPFGVPGAGQQRGDRPENDHPRWHRGRHLERRGERMERRGGRWERWGHRTERREYRRHGARWERRGERFERHRGERLRHRRHQHHHREWRGDRI
jgi:Ni/Co efflux regulator RcnB